MRNILGIIGFALGIFCGQLVWNIVMQKKYDEKMVALTKEMSRLSNDVMLLSEEHLRMENSGRSMANYFITGCPGKDNYVHQWYNDCKSLFDKELKVASSSLCNDIEIDTKNAQELLKWLSKECKKYGHEVDKEVLNRYEIEIVKANELVKETALIRIQETQMFVLTAEPYLSNLSELEKGKGTADIAEQNLQKAIRQRDSIRALQ